MRDYLLPVAIVLAAVILAVASRYTLHSVNPRWTLDRWTGKVYYQEQTIERFPPKSPYEHLFEPNR